MGARVEPPCSLGEPPVPTQANSASVVRGARNKAYPGVGTCFAVEEKG